MPDDDAKAETVFASMDSDGAGMVLLIEFCDFVKKTEIDAGTPLGKLLDEVRRASSTNSEMK